MNSSKILKEFGPNSDLKSSNASIPRLSNLLTKGGGPFHRDHGLGRRAKRGGGQLRGAFAGPGLLPSVLARRGEGPSQDRACSPPVRPAGARVLRRTGVAPAKGPASSLPQLSVGPSAPGRISGWMGFRRPLWNLL